ncbi:hypothetical protein I7I50_07400 [Histoplasma capsulatum G186AR]|uniref:Uncharacterized protein n=1 Tax=Ajellomyces capsulatus TaxID=5037 RepID=A0A8H7YZL0_AJECA|nr:hypothetical protein I7I52_09528 [Histoplasma capsulatum]QSS68107.1 hypothetical protein I7I50_07400 [Histoplasma capsulatum G186AR]
MKSKISLAFLLSLTLSVSAAPLEQSIQVKFNNGVKTTEEGVISYHPSNAGLYLCDRAGFVGHCVHYATPFGQCVTIFDQFPHGKGVKSASSDQGSRCTLYSQPECHGDELQVHHPGYPDLRHQDWGDRARSYSCRPAE